MSKNPNPTSLLFVGVYKHIHVYIYIYKHVFIYAHIPGCIHTHTHVFIHTHMSLGKLQELKKMNKNISNINFSSMNLLDKSIARPDSQIPKAKKTLLIRATISQLS